MSAPHEALGDPQVALGAYESAPTIMFSCAGPDLVLTSANASARAMLGGRASLGRPTLEVVPEFRHQQLLVVAKRVLASGEAEDTTAWRTWPTQVVGSPREQFLDLTISPWLGEDSAALGVFVHGRDVTAVVLGDADGPEGLEELDRVVTMQDALLPQWLPVLPGVELAASCLVGQDETAAGGDWFDVVERPDGRVGLVVGDVAGHGLAAVAAMGQLRSVCHERVRHAGSLAEAMADLDSFAETLPEARAATVCVLVLDPRTGELEYCTAGHPPPLVVPQGAGTPRHLPGSGASPLATSGPLGLRRDRLGRDEVLVLYSDGIVQRPGRSLTRSTVELGQISADAAGRPPTAHDRRGRVDRVCEETLARMTRNTGYGDDIALLVAERTPLPEPLHLDLPADGQAVAAALRELRGWMDALRVRELDHISMQHAVDELVDNAVEHAYAGQATHGQVHLDVDLIEGGVLHLCLRDFGTWKQPTADGAPAGTRGLAIVRGMVDRLDIDAGEDGTLLTVHHRLSRPAQLLTGTDTGADRLPQGGVDRPFALRREGNGRLEVSGPVDAEHVHDLRDALQDAAPADRVVLDLERVTLLSSAAVQALYAARREARDRGGQMVLFAPPGSTAQHVLELVQLPYTLRDPDDSPAEGVRRPRG